jgi:outer membrane protein TolC
MVTLAPVALALALAQAGPAPTVLTLDDALRLARERNLDLKVLGAQLAQADEISAKAWSRYLPQATATGTYTRQKEIIVELPPEAGGAVPFQRAESVQGQLEVTQLLFSPSTWYGIRSAARSEEATSLSIGDARRALLFGVAEAYYGVASLGRAVEVSQQLLENAQRQEKDARVRFQAGSIAKVALLRAEIDRARAEQDLKRASNSYESARVALATLLDRPPDFAVTEPPPPPLPERPDVEQLVRSALDARLDIRAARARLAAAEATRKAAYGRYLPDLLGFGRYQRQNEAGFVGSDESWAAGVQLQWQIFDGGLRESDVREGSARIVEADASLRSAEAKVRQEISQALLDLDSARANAIKAREQRDLSAENLRLLDVSYRAGAATAVELADATATLRNAEIATLTEGLSAQLAALRVLQAAGGPDPMAR